MGTEAEQDLDQVTSEENELDELEGEEQQPEGEENEESTEGDEEQGAGETQPQKTFTQQELDEIVQKRITRLKKGKEPAHDKQVESELELEKERNKLLQMALEQAKNGSQKADEKPNPDNFDGGEYDPEYIQQSEEYRLKQVHAEARRIYQEERNQEAVRQAQESEARELEKAQVAHYQRALTLEVKDYDQTEDKVLEVLGNEAANIIIQGFDDSHAIIYHLGKNPDKLNQIANQVKSGTAIGTAKALAELGRISAANAVNSKSKPAPSPVDNLEGATPTASAVEAKINAAWKQYEKGAISMQEYINRKKAIAGKS